VLDLNLPGAGGFVIAQRLQQRQAPVAVLILSAQATVHSLAMARRLGVAGYLQKTAPLDELVLALKQLSQGGTYFGSGLARLADAAGEGMADARTAGGLAEREVDLMLGLTRGESVSALSRQLACARSEIYRSRTQLMNRIQARNPGEFLAYVASIGLAANASGAHDSALLSP
jgi:DNA-binding NarL/FixJ family response regulator